MRSLAARKSGLFIALVCCGAFAESLAPGTLWRNGAELSEFHLVVPANPSPMLKEAGDVFRRLWNTATRRTLSVSGVN